MKFSWTKVEIFYIEHSHTIMATDFFHCQAELSVKHFGVCDFIDFIDFSKGANILGK